MKAKYLILTVAVALIAVVWDLIDGKSFTFNWWIILPVMLGIGLYDSMLKTKTED
ncbi:MAG TPA: hypothetical protein VF534_31030 [Paraburkholderia sp.]